MIIKLYVNIKNNITKLKDIAKYVMRSGIALIIKLKINILNNLSVDKDTSLFNTYTDHNVNSQNSTESLDKIIDSQNGIYKHISNNNNKSLAVTKIV